MRELEREIVKNVETIDDHCCSLIKIHKEYQGYGSSYDIYSSLKAFYKSGFHIFSYPDLYYKCFH